MNRGIDVLEPQWKMDLVSEHTSQARQAQGPDVTGRAAHLGPLRFSRLDLGPKCKTGGPKYLQPFRII